MTASAGGQCGPAWVKEQLSSCVSWCLWVLEMSFSLVLPVVEANIVPDFLIRLGIRILLMLRLRKLKEGGVETQQARERAFIDELKQMPIAINTPDANAQHYEVDTTFYTLCLGQQKKYSCCFWNNNTRTLEEAEEAALRQVCERAQVRNGQTILDLGCGWGSLSLYLARHYPNARITGVSNSNTQRAYIMGKAKDEGLKNLDIITCDINAFHPDVEKFDRVLSVEMFEHMKNYDQLMRKVSSALKPGGLLFVHIFAHVQHSYHFDDGKDGGFNWMARTFFTGGTMPSASLLLNYQSELQLENQWSVNGLHYSKTLEAWLQRLDANGAQAKKVLARIYGAGQETKWLVNWRLFFLACSELFRFNGGNEWIVSHYVFAKPQRA